MGKPRTVWPAGGAADPAGFEALGEAYLEWLRARSYSPHTVHLRELHLKAFAAWCAERALGRPAAVTPPVIERYQAWLFHHKKPNGRTLSTGGQHNRLTALRGFYRWLTRQRHVAASPAAELELPRLPNVQIPRGVLTAAEVERVLGLPVVGEPIGLRDRAILETLYSTGMRRRELAQLRLPDVDATRGTLFVRQGKGKKDRVVPIGERALAWLEKYVHDVRPRHVLAPDDGTVFLTVQGGPLEAGHLSKVVKEYLTAAGIDKEGACHLFRHTAATLMLENGADIRFIQEMLGHAKLSTTQIYTRVSIAKLKEIHTATHPGAKLARRGLPEDDESARAELLSSLAAEAAEER
jgi:integrase/recombinase XerD